MWPDDRPWDAYVNKVVWRDWELGGGTACISTVLAIAGGARGCAGVDEPLAPDTAVSIVEAVPVDEL